jgi:hypothetical protein
MAEMKQGSQMKETNTDDLTGEIKRPPLDEITAELGVPVSQRGQPALQDHKPKRLVTREEAKDRGWAWYFDGSPCRYSHIAARRTANPSICSDCERVKAGEEPIYNKSKSQTFYPESRIKGNKDLTSPSVIATAPAAPLELPKKDQEFLAQLDELRDFDAAALAVGTKRGLIEARVSSNEMFRKALEDLCSRRGIAWSRAPEAEDFKWTPTIERQLIRRYIDTGILHTAREEMKIPASDYQDHMQKSSAFYAMIEEAKPMAKATLRERAIQDAGKGNDRLAKLLEDDPEVGIFTDPSGRKVSYLNPSIARQEVQKILDEARKMLFKRDALKRIAMERNTAAGIKPAPDDDDVVLVNK